MKRILDTVHGYIMVDESFVDHIIDTQLFQRLRRVEQTSIRAVYPSARHDRFIHSLGVFHIGSLIVTQLRADAKANNNWGETDATLEKIYGSYLSACLLHDIAHAPFSHTLERYYGQKRVLSEKLRNVISNNKFSADLADAILKEEPNFHEYASAIMAYREYKPSLDRLGYDAELVARMITGVFYNAERETHQIHNCLITLLHGKIIDADRLDYACRDVWASGYSTSSVDLRRLISALHIKKCEKDYNVCFESSSLNEIEGVLNVKDFQMKYVINHHVVNYEQQLLTMAAEHAAMHFFPNVARANPDNPGFAALGKVVNIDALKGEVTTEVGNLKITNVSDDDIVFLMKQDPNNELYQHWRSRKFEHFSLWKSRDEFYHFFPNVPKNENLKNGKFKEEVLKVLRNKGYRDDEILINEAKFKCRVQLRQLYLVVANDVVRYTDIKPEEANSNKDIEFYYVFISKRNVNDREEIKKIRMELMEELKETIKSLYGEEERSTIRDKIKDSWLCRLICGGKNE